MPEQPTQDQMVAFKGRIRIKRVKAEADLPVLMTGQFCWVKDTKRLYLGQEDGVNQLVADPTRLLEVGQQLRADIDAAAQRESVQEDQLDSLVEADEDFKATILEILDHIEQNAAADLAEKNERLAADTKHTSDIAATNSALATNSAGDLVNAQNDQKQSSDIAKLQSDVAANSASDATTKSAQSSRDTGQDAAQALEATNRQTGDATNAQAILDEANRAKAAEAANAAGDTARAATQNTRDTQQEAKNTEQDNSLTGLALRVAALESKQSRLIDQTLAFVAVPILQLNGTTTVDVVFQSPMPDTLYVPTYQPLGGLAVGAFTYTEVLNSRTTTGYRLTLKSNLSVGIAAQILISISKRVS